MAQGLMPEDAAARLALQGPNELPEASPPSPWLIFGAQFFSIIIWVLIGAAVISGLLGEWLDALAILAIVFLNAVLGFIQEYRAERSLAALKTLSVTYARVLRGGEWRSVPSGELVVGDVVSVEAGDRVPADLRLFYATALRTQEAALTGESTPVEKHREPIGPDPVPLADQHNMLFLGTTVTAGKGRALVVATGIRTELGRIAKLMTSATVEPTPLQRRLEHFGHLLLALALVIVAVVFVLGLWRGERPMAMFLTAVSLAVAAIPEGLPAIVTMTLAFGVTRMVKRHALIRRLPAVETLGAATVICTDKTGTLTKNEMTVTDFYLDGLVLHVTGEGYSPSGEIVVDGTASVSPEVLRDLLMTAALCNGAALRQSDSGWTVVGDPTEGALLVAAAKAGWQKEDLERRSTLVAEFPFDPDRKMMTVVRRWEADTVAYVKGAPDVLLNQCSEYTGLDGQGRPLSDHTRASILSANRQFAQRALRVVALALKKMDGASGMADAGQVECRLRFIGLAAMKDPLRPEAKRAVALCRAAGIVTVMITGDHKDTATAIAREAGLSDESAHTLSGLELNGLSDTELADQVERTRVYARVSAEHKLRIVRAWRGRGAVVAMTGDGVNDAPAVREADIGIAMGMTGTDVTKEASDMVVTDDNFASIAAAVEEGRGIFDNIRKAVQYLLSCNLSEVLVMLGSSLFGWPLPLQPIQILWINLVTDGLPALALAVDPADPDVMRRPPRAPQAALLDRERLTAVCVQGVVMAAVTLTVFGMFWSVDDGEASVARTMAFTTLVFVQLLHAFSCRHERYSLFQIGMTTNVPLLLAVVFSALLQLLILLVPWGQEIFKATALTSEHWQIMAGLSLVPFVLMELWKAGLRRQGVGQPCSG
jgi:Ca2+-transporting ATPase